MIIMITMMTTKLVVVIRIITIIKIIILSRWYVHKFWYTTNERGRHLNTRHNKHSEC